MISRYIILHIIYRQQKYSQYLYSVLTLIFEIVYYNSGSYDVKCKFSGVPGNFNS